MSATDPPGWTLLRASSATAPHVILLGWLGAIEASRGPVSRALTAGHNLALVPGGIGEMVELSDTDEVVLLRSHKGFCRMALRHGAPLVPVFTFGNSELLHGYAELLRRSGHTPRRAPSAVQLACRHSEECRDCAANGAARRLW